MAGSSLTAVGVVNILNIVTHPLDQGLEKPESRSVVASIYY